jgi:uncharacterized protein (TIGR02271 family)
MREADDAPGEVIRHQEELHIGTRTVGAGSVRAHKEVAIEHVTTEIPRSVEQVESLDRTGPHEQDSGEIETLEDGSISIPVFEEQLVVTRRTVVKERVIVRKSTVIETQTIEADLRTEHVRLETDTR